MNPYTLEHLFSYRGTLATPPEAIGELAEGIRVTFYSTGGEVTGPKVRGRVKPVGGDWMTVQKNGTALMDVRTTFQTDDGALILVTYRGIADLGEDGYTRFLKGELPATVNLRMSPRFVTSHPNYAWLGRLHCLGIGEYRAATNDAVYDVYAVR
jgi:hypothetical protein